MFKMIASKVIAFDIEWVPDPGTLRVYYQEPDLDDDEIIMLASDEERLRTGAAPSAHVYLKTSLCRIASIAAVTRVVKNGSVEHVLLSMPKIGTAEFTEAGVINAFLNFVGQHKPQLIGFNIVNADLPILLQRSLAGSVHAPAFFERPEKPWEGMDYFSNAGDAVVDLSKITGGYGRATPALKELCAVAKIPGKMSTDGSMVAGLWREGKIKEIIEYNQFDAISTFLLWLRLAYASGHISLSAYEKESVNFREYITDIGESKEGHEHLLRYIEAWDLLESGGVYVPGIKTREPAPETRLETPIGKNASANTAEAPDAPTDEPGTESSTDPEDVFNFDNVSGEDWPDDPLFTEVTRDGADVAHGDYVKVRYPGGTYLEGTIEGKSGKAFRILLESGDKILAHPQDLIIVEKEPEEVVNKNTGEVIKGTGKRGKVKKEPAKKDAGKASAALLSTSGMFDDI